MRFLFLPLLLAIATALPTSAPSEDVAIRSDRLDLRSGVPPVAVAVAEPAGILRRLDQHKKATEAVAVADPTAAHDLHLDGDIEVVHRLTTSGKQYRIIRPKGSAAAERQAKRGDERALQKRYGGNVGLSPPWRPGNSDTVAKTSVINFRAGIDAWRIDIGGVFYRYRINFVNHQQQSYTFTDETGDTYHIETYVTGSHYIDYNSAAPSMIRLDWVQPWWTKK